MDKDEIRERAEAAAPWSIEQITEFTISEVERATKELLSLRAENVKLREAVEFWRAHNHGRCIDCVKRASEAKVSP